MPGEGSRTDPLPPQPPCEVVRESARGRVTACGGLLQAFEDHHFHRRVQVGPQQPGRRHPPPKDLGNQFVLSLARERTSAGQQFVEDNAQGPDIGCGAETAYLPLSLFRGHVR
jgi:hypothetical protein